MILTSMHIMQGFEGATNTTESHFQIEIVGDRFRERAEHANETPYGLPIIK